MEFDRGLLWIFAVKQHFAELLSFLLPKIATTVFQKPTRAVAGGKAVYLARKYLFRPGLIIAFIFLFLGSLN
ncbi:hypothetical protein LAV84_30670 [Rhizobium sp. VS19-DR104.2]|uniref:hypothetical protein n=1 Tax=unclassified Rhizobium TaxID=2613769 RepID=UPI001CC49890|nr:MULTISPECIES: hypothetical protein [unclassified Rhizobium]MBZ5763818.1 hypothetical protein [Rhizobium sp. VS19-DR96]MBZ5769759.1 hypothetical protein [Rhizobium sp. VS19-DR129.2]MBZ5777301.1 hypothetical protein [Rhizobium sp. VS19-DRK62.2]MBZ5788422.1 hypothetical protein [Rhizobium sp. VS19-DR121]MBZ5805871.1 hypothetical protein [Rhizobium sp. VS19-DR181]